MFDVLIKNGRVVDGTGNPWFSADIGICGDRIVAVGHLSAQAELVVDADGQIVAPGFIDIHTHSDTALLVDGSAQSHTRQGVTTNVLGNCGSSLAPLTDETAERIKNRRMKDYPNLQVDWRSMKGFLARLHDRISVNVCPLVGHGTIRGAVMGYVDSPPDSSQLDEMKDMVRAAMEDGAFGLSSGLIYVPGSYAETDEVAALAEVASELGGIYATHIRGENDTLMDALAEALAIGRRADIPVQISHLKAMGRHMWGKSKEALQLIEQARQEGIEVTCDQYPYNASATGLGAYLPRWAHVGGTEKLMERLDDPQQRERIRKDILEGTEDWTSLYKGVGWENTIVTRCSQEHLEGKTIAEIAEERGEDEFDTAFDVLRECEGNVGVVYFTIGDEDLERIMQHPVVMIGSDSSAVAVEGPLAKGKPHPRAFGTFARVLGRYVRGKSIISLPDAVRRMTSLPAKVMGLTDRGILREGMKADLVVFDPSEVIDRATYTEPFAYADGIEHVIVNGKHTICEGKHTGVSAGRVLKPQSCYQLFS